MTSKSKASRRKRFLTVAERRTCRVIEALRLLSACGNRATYLYEEHEVKKIFEAIQGELDRTRMQFHQGANRKAVTFSFQDEA